jgi:hypothetical protein
MPTDTKINSAEWRVVGHLRHEGVTYGPNEPLPELTLEQAEEYEVAGLLIRVGRHAGAQEFLDAADGVILQRVYDERPSKQFLEEMITIARNNSRSKILELALMIAARGARSAARSDR